LGETIHVPVAAARNTRNVAGRGSGSSRNPSHRERTSKLLSNGNAVKIPLNHLQVKEILLKGFLPPALACCIGFLRSLITNKHFPHVTVLLEGSCAPRI
jgi:hypothetical protein